MTTRALSEHPTRGYWNTAFFLGELRRSWANSLLYALIYFFGMVIPMLNDYSTILRSDFYDRTRYVDYSDIPFELFSVYAFGIAVWAAISGMRYLHKRISAYHFHSMPIRREGLFFVKSAVALSDFLIALLPNLAAAAAIFASVKASLMPILYIGLYSLLAFAVGYSFCVLIGSLCGTRSFHLILTGIVGFLGPAILSAVYLIADSMTSYLMVDYLTDYRGILGYSSPFIFFISQLERFTLLPLGAALALILFSVVCFVGTVLILRIRPTEGAETPVIFKPIARILKYTVMSLAAVFFGYFFEEIFNNDFIWAIFGIVSGAVLSFMLMNVLLTRNARKMFSGAIGLLVFAVAFSAVTAGLGAWYVHQDTNGFSPDAIRSVAIGSNRNGSNTFTVDDPAAIEAGSAFVDAYFAHVEGDPYGSDGVTYVEIDQKEYALSRLDPRTIFVTQTNKLGFSRTWRIQMDLYPELDGLTVDFLRTVADSEDFAEQYIALFDSFRNDLISERTIVEYADGRYYEIDENTVKNSAEYRALLEEIKAEVRAQIGFEFFQQRKVGEYSTRVGDLWVYLPVYESQPKLIHALRMDDYTEKDRNYADFLEYGADELAAVHYREDGTLDIVNLETIDEETVRALYDSSAVVYGHGQAFFMTRLSREYSVSARHYNTFVFIEGKVPQFVVDLFSQKK